MTSQEQELLTRVADAIAKGIAKNLSPNDIAHAAIEAMMEPTEAMIEYANEHVRPDADNAQCVDFYRAMLRAATDTTIHGRSMQ